MQPVNEVVFEPLTGELPADDKYKELVGKIYVGLGIPIDIDIQYMSSKQLVEEILKLRNTLRSLRDRTGHALCWYNPEIWNVLPEKIQPHPELPCKPEFLHNCEQFWTEQEKSHGQH